MNSRLEIQPWFERYPERFAAESAILAARGYVLNQDALRRDRLVEFSGRSQSEPERTLIVHLPVGFPSFPPRIHDAAGLPTLNRHHRGDTRELCLFGPGSGR